MNTSENAMFRRKTVVITFCFKNFLQDWPWYSS